MRRKELRIQTMCENRNQFFCEEKNDMRFPTYFHCCLTRRIGNWLHGNVLNEILNCNKCKFYANNYYVVIYENDYVNQNEIWFSISLDICKNYSEVNQFFQMFLFIFHLSRIYLWYFVFVCKMSNMC